VRRDRIGAGFRCLAIFWLCLVAAACTKAPQSPSVISGNEHPEASRCNAVYATIAAEAQASATSDAEASKIPGFPFLRTNRFLASFDTSDMNATGYRAWAERLRALALESYRVEVGNLESSARNRLDDFAKNLTQRPAMEAAAYCGNVLMSVLLASPEARNKLHSAIDVPDHYDTLQRVVGAYPLTALPVALGYDRWRQANLGTFDLEPRLLPTVGKHTTYHPASSAKTLSAAEVRAIVERSRANPLGIPEPSARNAAQLFDAFAPIWIVDSIGPDDRIGAISWDNDDALVVATDRPVVYHRISWTRIGGAIHLQLNYLAWFPARPTQGALDLLGGPLDGVIWRVTLGNDGRPLIYDSIHACGCYHLFFPAARMVAKPGPPPHHIEERAEVPARGPDLPPGHRVAVWLAGVSHYLQGLSTTATTEAGIAAAISYDLVPADKLRRLSRPAGGARSMYRPDGIVDGTDRLERFLLWPMGIASPGAMRQWGTHATAFIGRRHFDDPRLIDDAFHTQGALAR